MGEKQKSYDELNFTDDFMFCKILSSNMELAKELISLILGIKIRKVELAEAQKSFKETYEGRGIRLDVYVEDNAGTVYDVEMQTTKQTDLAKRTRYYQGMIDMHLINRGARYAELKKSYIIFICMEDPFSAGRCIYTFKNYCAEDKNIKLQDEATKVFLNPKGDRSDLSAELNAFMDYLLTNSANSDFTKTLENQVIGAKIHEEWRTDYMTLQAIKQEEFDKGEIKGRTKERSEIFNNIVSNIMKRDPSKTREQAEKEAALWIS